MITSLKIMFKIYLTTKIPQILSGRKQKQRGNTKTESTFVTERLNITASQQIRKKKHELVQKAKIKLNGPTLLSDPENFESVIINPYCSSYAN